MSHINIPIRASLKDRNLSAWRGPAAYLYILGLDPVSLAWEYLRRNALYRATWAIRSTDPTAAALRWGLKTWEDPERDARLAEPIWWPIPLSSVILTPSNVDDAGPAFQLWRIPGRKSLVHERDGLYVTAKHARGVSRVVLAPDLAADSPYAYQVSAGAAVNIRCRSVQAFDSSYRTAAVAPSKTIVRPTRSALIHARILQAIDGAAASASHRDIAEGVFGWEAVSAGWSSDSELRAQIRYFLRRGRALTGGGYRSLLNRDST